MSHSILLFQTYNVDGVPDIYLVSATPTNVTADLDYLPMGPPEGPQVTQLVHGGLPEAREVQYNARTHFGVGSPFYSSHSSGMGGVTR